MRASADVVGCAGSTQEELVYRLSGAWRAPTTRSARAGRWASPAWPVFAAATGLQARSARATRPSANQVPTLLAGSVCPAHSQCQRTDEALQPVAGETGRHIDMQMVRLLREPERALSAGWNRRNAPDSANTRKAARQCARANDGVDWRPERSAAGNEGSCTAFLQCEDEDVSLDGGRV